MVGVFLGPSAVNVVIDIISERTRFTRGKYRPPSNEPFILPIIVKAHSFGDTHRKYDVPHELQFAASTTDNYVPNRSFGANLRLAAR